MRSGSWLVVGVLLLAALGGGPAGAVPAQPIVLRAEVFGARGDGRTDDGPAVLRMLDAAAGAKGPVRVQFSGGGRYYLKSGRGRYAFPLEGFRDLTLDGGGSLFLIDSEQRFLTLTHSRNVSVRNLKVDTVPLPFAEGTVTALDRASGALDIRLDPGVTPPPPGGPTHADGEQAFFGSLWSPGPYGKQGTGGAYWVRHNFEVREIRHTADSRVVRVLSTPGDPIFSAIRPGEWRFSIPVPGIAHRYGPGESCRIAECSDITFENVELWSAPWFAFGISGNRGRVTMRRVAVLPKPGSGRIASSWRDAFHVKNNRAKLLFEECVVQGSGDDAFNIASHTSTVGSVGSGGQISLSQNFPLGIAAMEAGDTLRFYSPSRGVMLGRARIAHVVASGGGPNSAPLFTVELAAPIAGIEAGKALVWNEESSNPDTTLRGCRMDTSCRFRSPVTLEACQFNALAWFTGDEIEGPVPYRVAVRRCQFRLGQGNPDLVFVLDAPAALPGAVRDPAIDGVELTKNRFWGDCLLADAADVTLTANAFEDARRSISLRDVRRVSLRGNTRAGRPIQGAGDLRGLAPADAAQLTFRPR